MNINCIFLFFAITFLCCNKTQQNFVRVNAFPENGGYIEAYPEQFNEGEQITLIAHSMNGHFFYRWQGDTLCHDSIIQVTFLGTNRFFTAIFAVEIIADSQLVIANRPDSIIQKGHSALFAIALNLPIDSTYLIDAICDFKYNFSTSMSNATGIDYGFVGCGYDSITTKDLWRFTALSYKSKTAIINTDFTYYYPVKWQ